MLASVTTVRPGGPDRVFRLLVLTTLLACACALFAGTAGATRTSSDRYGTIAIDGVPTFPLVLSNPPSLDGTTPWGTEALDEVVRGGVSVLIAGPSGPAWTEADLPAVEAWNRAAVARGVHTWVRLRELALAVAGTSEEERLKHVVGTLRDDPAVAMWMGVDEPWWSRVPVDALRHAHGLIKAMDPDHLLLVNQAPRGTAADLAPYSGVADVHSVDVYPVKFHRQDPDLHAVGVWTQRIASVTPQRAVLTVLQICFSGSDDPAESGAYILPTRAQARYMAYDAIMNGARGLSFYGGHVRACLAQRDLPLGWNWAYWRRVLEPLLREIGPKSRLHPFLLTPGTALRVRSSDARTPVVARRVGRGVWVIAARHRRGTARIKISGLPRTLARFGWVYREGRRIPVHQGAFSDSFDRWDVHVYRFRQR